MVRNKLLHQAIATSFSAMVSSIASCAADQLSKNKRRQQRNQPHHLLPNLLAYV
jgi:hypothetical protein